MTGARTREVLHVRARVVVVAEGEAVIACDDHQSPSGRSTHVAGKNRRELVSQFIEPLAFAVTSAEPARRFRTPCVDGDRSRRTSATPRRTPGQKWKQRK